MLNQPLNLTINRLGRSLLWEQSNLFSGKLTHYSLASWLNISSYIRILFKSGIIYTHHLFFNKFFILSNELLSLPVYISETTYPKFYRTHRVKVSQNFQLKGTFETRRYLQYLNLTHLKFFKLADFLLIQLLIYIPFTFRKKNQKVEPVVSKKLKHELIEPRLFAKTVGYFSYKVSKFGVRKVLFNGF